MDGPPEEPAEGSRPSSRGKRPNPRDSMISGSQAPVRSHHGIIRSLDSQALPRFDQSGLKLPPRSEHAGLHVPPRFDAAGLPVAPRFDQSGLQVPPRFDHSGLKPPPRFDQSGLKLPPRYEDQASGADSMQGLPREGARQNSFSDSNTSSRPQPPDAPLTTSIDYRSPNLMIKKADRNPNLDPRAALGVNDKSTAKQKKSCALAYDDEKNCGFGYGGDKGCAMTSSNSSKGCGLSIPPDSPRKGADSSAVVEEIAAGLVLAEEFRSQGKLRDADMVVEVMLVAQRVVDEKLPPQHWKQAVEKCKSFCKPFPPKLAKMLQRLHVEIEAYLEAKQREADKKDKTVVVNVYDLLNPFVNSMTGAYHTGIEVGGREYNFGGGGVWECAPRQCGIPGVRYKTSIAVGTLKLNAAEFAQILTKYRTEWVNCYVLVWPSNIT